LIYDAASKQLVKNVVTYTVFVTPADLPLDQEPVVATRLGAVLNADPVDIEGKIDSATGSMYTPVKVADNVDIASARFIDENSDALPGVTVSAVSKRQYLDPALFSQIIGYTGQITEQQYAQWTAEGYSYSKQDVVGQAGIENSYESILRGTPGTQTVALDAAGKPIPGLVNKGTDPVPGSSLTLTIDSKEQKYAETALQWGLDATHRQSGVIIVENPQNGAILAMVSLPTYNDQLFADGISETDFQKLLTDPNQPLLNKAIGAQYAPGSTYKLVTGTAGLQDQPSCSNAVAGYSYCNTGTFNASTKLISSPEVIVNGYPYREWQGFAWYGPGDILAGLAHSSDTFFYQLARMVGIDRLAYWAEQYGFGRPTGIDLPGEAIGIVPSDQWKIDTFGENQGMFTGEILQAGIGQGYDASTALQLLDAYCAMANGGNVWQPHVVQSITPPGGKPVPVQPTLLNKLPASAQTLQTMREATRAVVTSRHTYNLVDLPVEVAGKTGTAEFGVKDKNGKLPYSEWFVGYTPGDPYNGDFSKPDSQLAVVAFVYGANSLGNVATEIVKYYMMEHYGITRYPLSQVLPYRINTWAARRTNYYNLGQLN
jgi:penicillin-binding protein 2